MIEETNEVRQVAYNGDLKSVFDHLIAKWPMEQGERVVAEVGNDTQTYTYAMRKGHKEIPVTVRGWKQIFYTTCLAKYKKDNLEAWCVMLDGGRSATRIMMHVKIAVRVYRDGVEVGQPIIVKDDVEEKMINNKRSYRLLTAAADKLVAFLEGMRVETRTIEEVTIATPRIVSDARAEIAMTPADKTVKDLRDEVEKIKELNKKNIKINVDVKDAGFKAPAQNSAANTTPSTL